MNTYYKFNDDWFTYYVNTQTGEKKFRLEKGDIEVPRIQDDFQEVRAVPALDENRGCRR